MARDGPDGRANRLDRIGSRGPLGAREALSAEARGTRHMRAPPEEAPSCRAGTARAARPPASPTMVLPALRAACQLSV